MRHDQSPSCPCNRITNIANAKVCKQDNSVDEDSRGEHTFASGQVCFLDKLLPSAAEANKKRSQQYAASGLGAVDACRPQLLSSEISLYLGKSLQRSAADIGHYGRQICIRHSFYVHEQKFGDDLS